MPLRTVNSTVDVPIVRNRFTIHAEHPAYAGKIMRSTLRGANSHVVETGALLTSELVGEAMLHSAADPELFIDTMEDHIRVEVRGFDKPCGDVDRVGMRECVLLMMNALASSWGIESRGDFRIVWFDLSL